MYNVAVTAQRASVAPAAVLPTLVTVGVSDILWVTSVPGANAVVEKVGLGAALTTSAALAASTR